MSEKELPENIGITHVLYHGNCFDGFTSAWIARRAGVDESNLFPMHYGAETPGLPEDAHVLMVDFSLPRPELIELREKVASLTVIDHHKTAEAQLHGLEWAYFDMNESGASLAWKFFNPDDDLPKFVKYIREHDLWRFELPDSAEIRAYIRSYPMTHENWDDLNTTLSMDFAVAQQQGAACARGIEAAVNSMCDQAVWIKIGGYTVPVVNATIYFSEVATRLLKMCPTAEFACYYMDRGDGKRQWGMRSRSEFDVSAVAKRYGGGGHAQAAGFTTETPEIIGEQ